MNDENKVWLKVLGNKYPTAQKVLQDNPNSCWHFLKEAVCKGAREKLERHIKAIPKRDDISLVEVSMAEDMSIDIPYCKSIARAKIAGLYITGGCLYFPGDHIDLMEYFGFDPYKFTKEAQSRVPGTGGCWSPVFKDVSVCKAYWIEHFFNVIGVEISDWGKCKASKVVLPDKWK